MPDQVQEFVNEAYTYAEIKQGVDIVTTGVNEQVVIKDVVIEGGGEFDLLIDGTTVASSTSGSLSGHELVGESSTVTVKGEASRFLVGDFYYDITATGCKKHSAGITRSGRLPEDVSGKLAIDHEQVLSPLTVSTLTWTSTTNAPTLAHFSASGDFYYVAGNNLYKKTGGTSGVITDLGVFSGTNSNWCKDSRYIYGFTTTTNLRICDTHTDAITNVTLAGARTWSNYRCAAIDGFILHRAINGIDGFTAADWLDTTTGLFYGAGLIEGIRVGVTGLAVGKRSDGKYVAFFSESVDVANATPPYEDTTDTIQVCVYPTLPSVPESNTPIAAAGSVLARGSTDHTVAMAASPDGSFILAAGTINSTGYRLDMFDCETSMFYRITDQYTSGALAIDPSAEADRKVRATGILTTLPVV